MKSTTIITIVLGILLLVSVVQAFQLNTLKTNIAEGKVSVSASSTGSTPSTSAGKTSSMPASIKDLPQMVGGC